MSNFPTKQNPQLCKNGCNTKIYLSDKKQKGSYLPYELDDSVHECPNYQKQDTATTTTEQEGPTIKQLKIWIARLDKAGVHIDINEILNPKQEEK